MTPWIRKWTPARP